MVAISVDEVEPGLVVFLDQEMLDQDSRVFRTQDLSTVKSRLFICFGLEANQSEWAPITTQGRRERLLLDSVWRTGGEPKCSGGFAQWLNEDQYLADGANTYRGPVECFVDASHIECSAVERRARLSAAGVEAVQFEVDRQQFRRHRQ